jgi:hypothetical protein
VSTTGRAARMNGPQPAPGYARLAVSTRAHQTSLSSGRLSTPGPRSVITQALFSAACAYGHNSRRELCAISSLEVGQCQRQ